MARLSQSVFDDAGSKIDSGVTCEIPARVQKMNWFK